ncbi:MAG: ABC transporter ATP-binding protein, partial [Promethearchaeota archaeon]
NINLKIRKNEFITIQGPSGAGKTTLLNIIGTLDRPTAGKVLIDDVDVSVMNEDILATWRALNLGFIFQSFNLISTLTVKENIAFPAVFWGKMNDIEKHIEDLLEMIELKDREDHLPAQLSAGEQQRVAIARALINDPPIIIADEPTANLDVKTSDLIVGLFKEIKESNEKTIIIASHDRNILDLADNSLLMDAGKITSI